MPKKFCCVVVLILTGSLIPNICPAETSLAEQTSDDPLVVSDPTFVEAAVRSPAGSVFEMRIDRPRGCECPVTVRYQIDANRIELIVHTDADTRIDDLAFAGSVPVLPADSMVTGVPFTQPARSNGEVALDY